MIKKSFYIGLNDKDTLKQEEKTAQAIKKIKQVLFYHGFNYLTITAAQGVYVMESGGAQVEEKTIKVDIIESILNTWKNRKAARACVEDLKKVLNQESILVEYSFIKATF